MDFRTPSVQVPAGEAGSMASLPELDEDEDDGAYDDPDGVGDGLDEDEDDEA